MAAAAVCGVLGRRTLGRGAISATSAYGLGRGKAGEEEAQAGTREGGGHRGARLCASERVGRERLVPLVCMCGSPSLSLALSVACARVLFREHRVQSGDFF